MADAANHIRTRHNPDGRFRNIGPISADSSITATPTNTPTQVNTVGRNTDYEEFAPGLGSYTSTSYQELSVHPAFLEYKHIVELHPALFIDSLNYPPALPVTISGELTRRVLSTCRLQPVDTLDGIRHAFYMLFWFELLQLWTSDTAIFRAMTSSSAGYQLNVAPRDRLCEYALGSDGITADVMRWASAGQRIFELCRLCGTGVLFYQNLPNPRVKENVMIDKGLNQFGHLIRETLLGPFVVEQAENWSHAGASYG